MTIVDHRKFIKVSVGDNNNKFYELILHDNGTLEKKWGRVGTKGQAKTDFSGKAGFDKETTNRAKKEYRPVDVVDTPRSSAMSDLMTVATKKIPKTSDAELVDLIEKWCAANRHQIEAASGGLISVSDTGVVKTALGIVSAQTISDARAILLTIAGARSKQIEKIEHYLSLIPQDIGRRRGWEEDFVKPEQLAKQQDFLDTLDGSLAMATSLADDSDEPDAVFKYHLSSGAAATDQIFKKIQAMFSSTKNQIHTSSNMKLSKVIPISHTDPSDDDTWRAHAKTYSNVKQLWHGTGDHNLISILHRGLFVPPVCGGTFTTTGRMFGDGVYFSDQSTKALNYAQGYWSGTRNHVCYMLLADVVMGSELRPTTYGAAGISQSRNGKYHSINVQGGTCGVRNNEMIVWNTEQINLAYLCEFRS